MHDIAPTITAWVQAQQPVALATVVQTWGSAPRQAGAQMGITADLHMTGSVSGGCVEAAVADEALHVLADGQPRLFVSGVADESAWSAGLACGGTIHVFIEPLDSAWWQIATTHMQHEQPLATATVVQGPLAGGKVAADTSGIVFASAALDALDEAQHAALAGAAQEGLTARAAQRQTVAGLDVFVDVQQPRPRLVMVGGTHIAVALQHIAQVLGFRVFLIDPREAFATQARFPLVEQIIHAYPDRALPALGLTDSTYLVILTHDPKIDDPALRIALPGGVPYVGILSSRRTHARRVARLTAAGLSPALLERIHVPIGLDIGAQTPAEIALCIMAEIVAVRQRGVA
jgi:xanthine dehydrogenase accessory factor